MLEICFMTYKDGDERLSPNSADYVGGQPLGPRADGTGYGLVAGGTNFAGLARNDIAVDTAIGKVTVMPPGCEVIIKPSLVSEVKVYPYAEDYGDYVEGDQLGIDGNGKLTRTIGALVQVALVLRKVGDEGLKILIEKG